MHSVLKLFYLILFVSLDILLYLRLGKQNRKIQPLLIITVVIAVITLVLHLPVFNLPYILSFKNFMILFGMDIQAVIVNFIGLFIIARVERVPMFDDQKEYVLSIFSAIFKTGIFMLFIVVHVIYTLIWP